MFLLLETLFYFNSTWVWIFHLQKCNKRNVWGHDRNQVKPDDDDFWKIFWIKSSMNLINRRDPDCYWSSDSTVTSWLICVLSIAQSKNIKTSCCCCTDNKNLSVSHWIPAHCLTWHDLSNEFESESEPGLSLISVTATNWLSFIFRVRTHRSRRSVV